MVSNCAKTDLGTKKINKKAYRKIFLIRVKNNGITRMSKQLKQLMVKFAATNFYFNNSLE